MFGLLGNLATLPLYYHDDQFTGLLSMWVDHMDPYRQTRNHNELVDAVAGESGIAREDVVKKALAIRELILSLERLRR